MARKVAPESEQDFTCNGYGYDSSLPIPEKKPEESQKNDFENGLRLSGSCGRFQKILTIIMMYFVLTVAYVTNFAYFVLDSPAWKCISSNQTTEFCKENTGKEFSSDSVHFTERCRLNRTDWAYVTDTRYSAVTEFDLVCDKAALAALASSMIFIGGLIGGITSGKFADAYGRKPVMYISFFLNTCSTIGCAFVTNIEQLIVARALMGATFASCFNISMVYLMEFVSPRYRAITGTLYQATYCLSLLLSDGLAYFVRHWRHLSLYIALPSLVTMVISFFLPESPRWLLAANKVERAEHILKKIAKCNKRSVTQLKLEPSDDSNSPTYTFFHLFRYRTLVTITFALGLLWATASMVYFAIALESSKLGGNMYSVFAYSSMVEIPSTFISPYLCNRFGRKKTILGSELLAGLFTGCIALVPRGYSIHHSTLTIVFAIIAKFFINIAYVSIYIWSFEIYPTVIRSQGISVCIISDRVGGLSAPFLVRLLHKVSYSLPFIIMGTLAVVASLFGLLLPETNKMATRESFEDIFEGRKRTVTQSPEIGVCGNTEINEP